MEILPDGGFLRLPIEKGQNLPSVPSFPNGF
jgi:hypothetical protein